MTKQKQHYGKEGVPYTILRPYAENTIPGEEMPEYTSETGGVVRTQWKNGSLFVVVDLCEDDGKTEDTIMVQVSDDDLAALKMSVDNTWSTYMDCAKAWDVNDPRTRKHFALSRQKVDWMLMRYSRQMLVGEYSNIKTFTSSGGYFAEPMADEPMAEGEAA